MWRASAWRRSAWAVASSVLLGGCYYSKALPGELPTADNVARDSFGAWVRLQWLSPQFEERAVVGELIALTPDTAFVLTWESLVALPVPAIRRVEAELYDQPKTPLTLWTAAGIVSSLYTHGFFFFSVAPAWGLTGALSMAGSSKAPAHDALSPTVAKFARFPQGLPAGLDRTALKPRPRR